MSTAITIPDYEVHNIKMIEDEAEWSIRPLNSGVGPKTEGGEHSGDQWTVECYIVKHGTISAIGHKLEGDQEFDSLGHLRLRNNKDRLECNVINVVKFQMLVFGSLEERGCRVVSDG
jgi:hypothetical protein